ncbi:MAG TPA: GtrA family protein [Candidatus Bathyarchaeia archaeon]|nr:GtrA family protein [Candidatus Bathyarchaeia archaeon]
MTLEDRLRNPFVESLARRQYSQAALYRAALVDTRYSSGFGMTPQVVKPSRIKPAAWLVFKFGFVGGLGLFLNEYLMFILGQISALNNFLFSFIGGSYYILYAVISSQGAVLFNFVLNDFLVFRGRRTSGLLSRFAFFNSLASADLLVRLPILWGFTAFLNTGPLGPLVSNFESILLTFGGRFVISAKKIWPKTAAKNS